MNYLWWLGDGDWVLFYPHEISHDRSSKPAWSSHWITILPCFTHILAIIVPCLSHFPTIIPFKNDGFSWVNPHISRHRKGRNLALALAAHPPGSSTERPSRRWSAAPSIAPRRIATRRAPRAGAQIGCLESIPQGKRGGFFSWENPMENRLIINDDKNCWIVHWTSCF